MSVRTAVGTPRKTEDAREAELFENSLHGSWMARSGAKRRKTVAGCVGSEAQRRIKFECRMLQRWENEAGQGRWSTMSCDVEDDFDSLRSLSWPMEAFCEQTRVVLLHAGATTPSTVNRGFARMGTVVKGWPGSHATANKKLALCVDQVDQRSHMFVEQGAGLQMDAEAEDVDAAIGAESLQCEVVVADSVSELPEVERVRVEHRKCRGKVGEDDCDGRMKLLRNTRKLVEEVGRTTCDECKKWVPTDSRVWHCDTCERDLCEKCGPVVPWCSISELQVKADAKSDVAEFRGPWTVVERGAV